MFPGVNFAPLIELSGMQLIEFAVGVPPRGTHLTHRSSNYLNRLTRLDMSSISRIRE